MDNNNSNVISLAPDALVFINGKDAINNCPNCNCGVKLRDVITNISIDLSITSSPGSASISIANPQHVDVPLIYKAETSFQAMMEVEIFIKGYFDTSTQEDTTIKQDTTTKRVTGDYTYYPVFWGFLTSVNESYSDGVFNISLSCKDILRWWEISRVNVNPSVHYSANFFPGAHTTTYDRIYSDQSIPEIVYQLSKITVNELLGIDNINETGGKVQINSTYLKTNMSLMEYWKSRFLQIGRNLRIFGFNGVQIYNSEKISEALTNNFKNQLGYEHLSLDYVDSSFALGVSGLEIDKILPSALHVQEVNGFTSEYESKLEIINTIKEVVQYEFYMDPTGEIIFKPPFYNVDVRNHPIHVIKDVEIIDWNFSEDETGIITRVEVAGNLQALDASNSVETGAWGFYVDYNLAEKYGLRVKSYALNWLRNSNQCQVYAQSEISRLNALLKSGSVTIIGRAEARIGYPVYIESKDAFYYVTGVAHAFSFGSTYTTQLSLSSERKKVYKDDNSVETDLAIIFQNNYEDKKVVYAAAYAQNLRKENPKITQQQAITKITSAFYLNDGSIDKSIFSDLQMLNILTAANITNPLQLTGNNNPLLRTTNDCLKMEHAHFKTQTFNAAPFMGNQGKHSYYYINKKLIFTTLEDYLAGMQITDSEGYSLIGIFPYGKDLTVLPTSKIGPKKLIDVELIKTSRLENLAFSNKPTEQVKKESINTDQMITYNNKTTTMLVQDNEKNKNAMAYNINVKSYETDCKCGCHEKYSLKLTKLPKPVQPIAQSAIPNQPAPPIQVDITLVGPQQRTDIKEIPQVASEQTITTENKPLANALMKIKDMNLSFTTVQKQNNNVFDKSKLIERQTQNWEQPSNPNVNDNIVQINILKGQI